MSLQIKDCFVVVFAAVVTACGQPPSSTAIHPAPVLEGASASGGDEKPPEPGKFSYRCDIRYRAASVTTPIKNLLLTESTYRTPIETPEYSIRFMHQWRESKTNGYLNALIFLRAPGEKGEKIETRTGALASLDQRSLEFTAANVQIDSDGKERIHSLMLSCRR